MAAGFGYILALRVVPTVWASLNVCYAIYKIYEGYKSSIGFKSVPMLVLLLELIANCVRVLLYAVDPWNLRRIYPSVVARSLLFLSYTFAFAAYLLVTIYWHTILRSQQVNVNMFLSKYKISVIVVIGGFCTLMIASSAAAFYPAEIFSIIGYMVVTIVMIFVIAVFMTTATRVLCRTRRMARSRHVRHFRLIMYKSIIMAVLLILFLGLTIVYQVSLRSIGTRPEITRLVVASIPAYCILLVSSIHISTLFSKSSKSASRITTSNGKSGSSLSTMKTSEAVVISES